MKIANIVKSALIAAPLSVATALAANAGGFVAPVVEPAIAPVVEVAAGDWQGAYAGATLGYAFGGEDRVGLALNGGAVSDYDKLELSGVNAGVRVGYRWQRNNWVFGPELGFEGGKIEDSFNADGVDASSEIKNVLALRFKTGYAVNPETLVYGIVGVARAEVDYSVEGLGADISDGSLSRTGYVVGLGAERKLTERLSLTGEYEYANFGKETLTDAAGYSTEATPKYHNVKLGLNFRF